MSASTPRMTFKVDFHGFDFCRYQFPFVLVAVLLQAASAQAEDCFGVWAAIVDLYGWCEGSARHGYDVCGAHWIAPALVCAVGRCSDVGSRSAFRPRCPATCRHGHTWFRHQAGFWSVPGEANRPGIQGDGAMPRPGGFVRVVLPVVIGCLPARPAWHWPWFAWSGGHTAWSCPVCGVQGPR